MDVSDTHDYLIQGRRELTSGVYLVPRRTMSCRRITSRARSPLRWLMAVACFGLAGGFDATPRVSAASAQVGRDLRYTQWQTENGLPSNKINDVLQTRDGFIWIATFDGLARFDGDKFTLFDENNAEGLLDHSLTCLFEAADGALWIGHSSGAVTEFKAGKFTTTPPSDHLSPGITRTVTADQAGDIWTYSAAGLLIRVKDKLTLTPKSGIAHLLIALTRSPTGKIWVANEGELSFLEGSRLVPIPLGPEKTPATEFVQGICATRDGGLWVASGDRIRMYKDGRWVETLCTLPFPGMALHVFKETARGQLVAGSSEHGLYLISTAPGGELRSLSRATGFASDWILSLCEDREGGLWVGTGGGGLLMIRHSQVDTPAPPDGWQSRVILSVSPSRAGGLWIGTEGAGLYLFRDGQWENFALKAGLRNPYVWSVFEDSHGVLWAGTWSNGVYTRAEGGFLRAPGLDRMNIPMPAICEASAGGLWVGAEPGLLRYQEGKATWVEAVPENRLHDVRAVRESADGTVWFGSNGGGLGRLKNGECRHFGKKEGLPSEFVQCLHLDANGALWIGTAGAGLVRFHEGVFSTLGTDQGLPNAVICHIEEDQNGYMWLSSHGGILRASKIDLDRCASRQQSTVDFLSYGLSDGMPSLDCSGGMQPAGCQLPDGRLAFGTSKGLAIIDPAHLELNPLPPPVSIVALKIDGADATRQLRASTQIVIPPGAHRLEFHYAGLSFAAPEKVRFKRRLAGLETDWVNVGTKRAVDYNYLPPGDYRFQVTACNNDGIWNPEGVTLAVTVLPFFWQTLWFKVLAIAALIGASSSWVWFETHRRLRQKLALLEQKRAVALERARIASDMHDDLGSQLTQITMLSETARSGLDNTAAASQRLTQIYDTARGLTRAMDEIVWAVNPKHDTMESLVTYLEKFALDFLGAAGLRCRLELPLEYPVWSPSSELRHNLFLAVKEALNNAVKHAGATVVLIALEISASDYQLTIQDDGRGFDPTAATTATDAPDRLAGGNGLENMRRRLARINGECKIVSAPGQGTKVILIVPATPPLAKA